MSEPVVTIAHTKSLLNTPALLLAVRAWYDLLENGIADDSVFALGAEHSAIVVSEDNVPVGVLTWFDQPYANALHVGIAYVLPQRR